ncbi:MAG TPA: hypothetical protein VKX40_11270, partial [Aequorivita sp.]|nr:hypothetical protein [Aequorivita sp.]
SSFVQQLPQLTLKESEAGDEAFGLYKGSEEKPVAVQYQEDSYRASLEEATAVVQYLQAVYNTYDSTPNEQYIAAEMSADREGMFGWKFYKKNNPLAVNPYRCSDKANTEEIGMTICDQVPPIDLNHCPPQEVVVCPEKDLNKYHYRICFENKNGLEFILISYVGYGSYEEAFEAWEKEWYEVINLAKNASGYGNSGKISLDENYKPADDTSCNDTSYIAVVPEINKQKLIEAGEDVVTFYTTMAHLFPIYEIKKGDKSIYKFKVVVEEEGMGSTSCEMMDTEIPEDDFGSLIWLGTNIYSCYSEAIKAYNHFYILAGTSQNCRILCKRGKYYVALIEVLVESFCKYASAEEAWDEAFATIDVNGGTYRQDACGDCLPGGVRSFFYASDDPKNFIPVYVDGYWTFKVVSPEYFVGTHTCDYHSETVRNQAVEEWESVLKNLNWDDYLKFEFNNEESESPNINLNANIIGTTSGFNTNDKGEERICELVFTIRKCLEDCSKNQLDNEELIKFLKNCLREKYPNDSWITEFIEYLEKNIDRVLRFVTYFPIFTTDEGHCYRIYWPDNDQDTSENGLQPCGCEENPVEEGRDKETACRAKYPFKSSKCYSCCGEALAAFRALCQLIEKDEYTIECTQDSDYGPYSFQIVDTSKELGYHPQSFKGYQEVLDAIEVTLKAANDTGMHLLEHILLRPKDQGDSGQLSSFNTGEYGDCLLPVCPDYLCPIDWYPDMDKDDPCAEDNPDVIHYRPGSDPYSFWASLALPAWVKRFRTQESRNMFEQLLYKEVPALVGLNILWLGPRDMCRFEDKFRLWLDWLQDPEAPLCDPNQEHPRCRIVGCIRELESEMPCPSIPGEDGDCNCEDNSKEEIDPCCLPPKTEGTIFWGNCSRQHYEPGTYNPIYSGSRIENLNGENDSQLLSQIRKRKPIYLANVEKVEASIKQTKSYERTLFFLNNTPTTEAYVQLVAFFVQYSLKGTANDKEYLTLLQNATWHLLDKLVLNYSDGIPESELGNLKASTALLNEKGLTNEELDRGWNSKALGTMASVKSLKQAKNVLNG